MLSPQVLARGSEFATLHAARFQRSVGQRFLPSRRVGDSSGTAGKSTARTHARDAAWQHRFR
jgi:hypothetical protein